MIWPISWLPSPNSAGPTRTGLLLILVLLPIFTTASGPSAVMRVLPSPMRLPSPSETEAPPVAVM
jgi:hypothetical protein